MLVAVSFREPRLSEAQFPRISLLGDSLNIGSGGPYDVLEAANRAVISSSVLSGGISSPCAPWELELNQSRDTLAKEPLFLSVDSLISLSQSQ